MILVLSILWFIKIYNKAAGSEGSNIAFRIHHNIWIVALISKKWRDTNDSTKSIIIKKLCKWQAIVLLVVIIYTKILPECLICVFILSINFRVVASSKVIYWEQYLKNGKFSIQTLNLYQR